MALNRAGGGRVLRAQALAAAIGACVLAVPHPAAAAAKKTVIYANVGGERVERAFASLREAVERSAPDPGGLRLEHVVINEADPALLREDMSRIVAMQPTAIVATSMVIALAAKRATATIPVIFGTWEDPVHAGLVDSFARPGANLTGFTFFLPLEEKRLELLMECFPKTKRIGVLADKAWLEQPHVAHALDEGRRRFGVRIEVFVAETEAELADLVASKGAVSIDAWYVPHTTLPFEKPDLVVQSLQRLGKPVLYSRTQYVEKGGLMAYQSELDDIFAVWATLITRVLAGIPPAIIPVERPRRFELSLRLGAVGGAGAALPRSILKRADRFY